MGFLDIQNVTKSYGAVEVLHKAERDVALAKVAKLLQIEQLLTRKPGQLSGGQRQRVAMGRTLVRNPKVFLFDEPLRDTISVTEPAGADTFVTMTLGGRQVVARMRADVSVGPGQSFGFAVNMDKAVAFDPKTEERIRP